MDQVGPGDHDIKIHNIGFIKFLGGISLVGRALDSKSKGREFKSLIPHLLGQLSWLERESNKLKVMGSSPILSIIQDIQGVIFYSVDFKPFLYTFKPFCVFSMQIHVKYMCKCAHIFFCSYIRFSKTRNKFLGGRGVV